MLESSNLCRLCFSSYSLGELKTNNFWFSHPSVTVARFHIPCTVPRYANETKEVGSWPPWPSLAPGHNFPTCGSASWSIPVRCMTSKHMTYISVSSFPQHSNMICPTYLKWLLCKTKIYVKVLCKLLHAKQTEGIKAFLHQSFPIMAPRTRYGHAEILVHLFTPYIFQGTKTP